MECANFSHHRSVIVCVLSSSHFTRSVQRTALQSHNAWLRGNYALLAKVRPALHPWNHRCSPPPPAVSILGPPQRSVVECRRFWNARRR